MTPPDRPSSRWNLVDFSTDQALVAGLVSGETGAARAFLERFGPLIRDLAMGEFHCDEAEARDLLQDLYLHLWEDGWRRLRLWSGRGSLAGYSRTTARRLLLARLGKARRVQPLDDDPEEEGGQGEIRRFPGHGMGDEADREALADCVREAMDRLPLRDRQLVRRAHWEDRSYREIAEAEGMTVNNVGVALHRAQKRLAALMERLCAHLVAAFTGGIG